MGAFIFLAVFGKGGLVGSDIFGYVNIALNGIKNTYTAYDRYFYLLLARIFLKAAPTPLQGAQWYWAFLIAASGLLIYLCARTVLPRDHPGYALLALAAFLSLGDIGNTDGTPGVDLAAMFMSALLVLIYLLSARRRHRSRWLIATFGFFLYLAFRTKESCLPLGILVFGFGFTDQDRFDWLVLARALLIVLTGFLVGLVIYAIGMWAFVGDPLFGLRLSGFKAYLASYASSEEAITGRGSKGLVNWYDGFFFTQLLLPFALYVISGLRAGHLSAARRWLWTVPLAVIVFITVTIGNKWGLESRFALPALPAIFVLWPQSLDLTLPENRRARIKAILILAGGILAIVALRLLLREALPRRGMDPVVFLSVVLNPLLLTCILFLFFVVKKPGLKTSLIISLLVLAMLVSPILSNIKAVFVNGDNRNTAETVLYPFASFSRQIVFTPRMKMYISKGAWQEVGDPYATKNIDEVLSLFNTCFDASAVRENFTYADFEIKKVPALLESRYNYLLLAGWDWQLVAKDPGDLSLVDRSYQVFFDPRMVVVLLKAR